MNTWSQEQLEEMFGDDKIDQLAFLAGCHENKLCNTPTDGWIIPDEVLREFAKQVIKQCVQIASLNDDETFSEGDIRARSIAKQIKNHFGV